MNTQSEISDSTLPLYVDLDGTLINTDLAQEMLVRSFRDFQALRSVFAALGQGAKGIKRALVETVPVQVDLLPYRAEILDYIKTAKSQGRRVVLATAADTTVATQVADHLGFFDAVIGSTPDVNLKGKAKLEAIQADAQGAFEYLGDSNADLPIWEAAAKRGFAERPSKAKALASDATKISFDHGPRGSMLPALLKAMRPHQWAKNVLVFVPLLFAHIYLQPGAFVMTLLAFLTFSMCASAVYLVNDLLDIEADRAHRTKNKRPFASGMMRPVDGVYAAALLFSAALLISMIGLGTGYTVVLVLYIIMTNAYSVWLKAKSTVDVIVLALLYTIRIIAGAAAIQIMPSPWLLTFSLFFFLSLAYMKRYIELEGVDGDQQLPARGYWAPDLNVIRTFGISSAGLSLLTLAQYVTDPVVQARYASPLVLWAMIPLMMFWSYRAWLRATRGQIGDDPVVFAMKDRVSRATGVLTLALVIIAHLVPIQEALS